VIGKDGIVRWVLASERGEPRDIELQATRLKQAR
jgi:hypothetical protein